MKHLLILVILLCLTSCVSIQTPIGTFNTAETSKPSQKKKSFKKTTGISSTVVVLLGVGAGFMLTSIGVITSDGPGREEFAVITGGAGLVLWGSAGIVHLAEDE